MKNITDIRKIKKILFRPFSKTAFSNPDNMLKALENAESKVTIHLYRTQGYKSAECISDFSNSIYNQIYFSIIKDKANCLITNGTASTKREYHNHMLDEILKNDKMQSMDSMIIVMNGRKILSYYHNPKFSYVNHDIGSNWDSKIIHDLEKSNIPYSQLQAFHDNKFDVNFHDTKDELIFRAYELDSTVRRFDEKFGKLWSN